MNFPNLTKPLLTLALIVASQSGFSITQQAYEASRAIEFERAPINNLSVRQQAVTPASSKPSPVIATLQTPKGACARFLWWPKDTSVYRLRTCSITESQIPAAQSTNPTESLSLPLQIQKHNRVHYL